MEKGQETLSVDPTFKARNAFNSDSNSTLCDKDDKLCKIIEARIREELDQKLSDAIKLLRLETEKKFLAMEEKLDKCNMKTEAETENNSTMTRMESNRNDLQNIDASMDEEDSSIIIPIQNADIEPRLTFSDRFSTCIKSSHHEFDIKPTVHAFAIFSLVKRHWTMAVAMISISYAFLALQYSVLSSTFIESFYPTCSAHTDCKVGTYCGSFSLPWLVHNGQTPRCFDCDYTSEKYYDNFPNCSSIANELQEWELESIDHTKFVYDSTVNVYSNESLCMSQIHCNATDTMESSCDDYVLNTKRVSRGYIKSLIFLSIAGLAPYYTTDVEESMVEERFLDCILSSSGGSMKWMTWLGAQCMYFLIRGRHLVLPFFIAQGATSIFLCQNFSVTNVVLNIVSVAFLIEIDDLFVGFIIPKNDREEMCAFFSQTLAHHKLNRVSFALWLWPRSISIAAVTAMIVVSTQMENIIVALNYVYGYGVWGNNCANYILVLAQLFVYVSLLFMMLHSIKAPFCSIIVNKNFFDVCIIFVLDLFRSWTALLFVFVVSLLSNEVFASSQLPIFGMIALGFGTLLTMLLIINKCYHFANPQH